MRITRIVPDRVGWQLLTAAFTALALFGGPAAARAQSATASRVVVELKDFSFNPSTVTVSPGDTIVFKQTTGTPHNVQFVKAPSGAKFGSEYVPPQASTGKGESSSGVTVAATPANADPTAPPKVGPFLLQPGAEYVVVIGPYFPPGEYDYVCTPHQSFGMKGKFIVTQPSSGT